MKPDRVIHIKSHEKAYPDPDGRFTVVQEFYICGHSKRTVRDFVSCERPERRRIKALMRNETGEARPCRACTKLEDARIAIETL